MVDIYGIRKAEDFVVADYTLVLRDFVSIAFAGVE
jgi:hypothetical protein